MTDTPPVDVGRILRRGAWFLLATVLVIVLGTLALGRTQAGGEAIADLRERADPLGLVAAVGLISLAQPCVAMRWRALLPRDAARPGVVVLTGFLCAGLVFNYALPGPVGELVTAGLLRRRSDIAVADGLASLVVSRIVGLGSACVVAGIVWLVVPMDVPPEYDGIVGFAAVAMAAAGLVLGVVAIRPSGPRALVDRALSPLAARDDRLGRLSRRVRDGAARLLDAVVATARRGPRAWAAAIAWACAGHLVVATGLALASWSIGADPSWSGVVFTYAAATAGAIVLFLFPGSHLGWDLSFAALLAFTAGMSATDAAAVTVVARVQQSFILLLGLAATAYFVPTLAPARADSDA